MKLVVQVNWLGRDGRRATHIHGQTRPYRHGGGKLQNWSLTVPFSWLGRVWQREDVMLKPWMHCIEWR